MTASTSALAKILATALLCAQAQAQTSSTSSSTAPAGSTAAAPTGISGSNAAPISTSTASQRKIKGTLNSQTSATVGALKESSSRPETLSYNSFGVSYKANETSSYEIRANFETKLQTRLDQKDPNGEKVDRTQAFDPSLHYTYKTKMKLLESAPIALASRYYVPVTSASKEAGSWGVYRLDTSLTWDLSPRIAFGLELSPRIYLSDPSGKQGGESSTRLLAGPQISYAFSDKLATYYGITSMTKSNMLSRGQLRANLENSINHEIGLVATLGNFQINPAMATTQSALNKSSYEGFGSDANTEYDLNIVASF